MSENKTIAIIGASSKRDRFSNKAVRAYLDQGYTVYPVNPTEDEIEGLKVYSTIDEVPDGVEEISVYMRPERTYNVLEAIAKKNPQNVYLNPGTDNDAVMQKVEELGINAVQACSIIAVGKSPSNYSSS